MALPHTFRSSAPQCGAYSTKRRLCVVQSRISVVMLGIVEKSGTNFAATDIRP